MDKKRIEKDIRTTQDILQRKDELLNTITQATTYMLSQRFKDNAVNGALEILGKYGIADRIYIFKNHPHDPSGDLATSQIFEWCVPEIEPQIDNPNLKNFKYEWGFQRWLGIFKKKNHISGKIEDLPKDEEEFLGAQGIKSILVSPIYVEDKLWGFMGFDDCTHGNLWSESEKDVLTMMATNIGGLIKMKDMEQDLVIATTEALEASLAKTHFLANMSHEIRTPMNAILGMAELLQETELNEEQIKYLNILSRAGNNLLMLINDILDVSKIEAGHIELHKEVFNIKDLSESIINMFVFKAKKKGIELSYNLNVKDNFLYKGDDDRLKQILINLFGNAVKFTHKGSIKLNISYSKKNEIDFLKFSVKDTGIGIPKEKLEDIFGRFIQMDSSITKKFGGTGLGLAICKGLVEIMDGELLVNSEIEKGSEFSFEIPVEVIEQKEEERSEEEMKKISIFIIDDNETNRMIFDKMLDDVAYKIKQSESGEQGFSALIKDYENSEKYDLLLLDFSLGITNGLEVAERIRNNELLKNLKIILLSSGNEEISMSRLEDLNIHSFLIKPLKKQVLIQEIRKNFKNKLITKNKKTLKQKRTLKLLLAEDTEDNRLLIKTFLKKEDIEITEALNGKAALNLFKENEYDLVLMDMQMPVMDGYTATKKIRKYEEDNKKDRKPIIALTAFAYKTDVEQSFMAGCDEHLTKPVKKKVLINTIKKYWGE